MNNSDNMNGNHKPQVWRARWIWCGPGDMREDSWIVMQHGCVQEVTGSRPAGVDNIVDLGDGIFLPGIVNSHTHLELSDLGNMVEPKGDFVRWGEELLDCLMTADRSRNLEAVQEAAESSARWGITLAGDISISGRSASAWQGAGISAVSFVEDLGPGRTEQVRPEHHWEENILVAHSVAAQSPYSVKAVRLTELKTWANGAVFSIHCAESRAEVEYLLGKGDEGKRMETFLAERGIPRVSLGLINRAPLEHLMKLGIVDDRTLLVHGVQLTSDDIDRLAGTGASLCVCPRSNLALTGEIADVPTLLRKGVNVSLGTDSMTSAPDLNIWEEMAALLHQYPGIEPEVVLGMATRGGARALQVEDEFGSLHYGYRGRMIFIPQKTRNPADIMDSVVNNAHDGNVVVL